MNNQKAVIFCAPSGAGKTTIVHHLLKAFDALQFSVSACSRPQRQNEVHGRDYYFLSVDEFKTCIEKDDFIEWEEVYADNFYGTLASEIDKIWANDRVVIFDVDVIGGMNLKNYFGDKALAVFVKPPSIEHLENRLKNRATETPESLKRRLGKAEIELTWADRFDHVLLNDNLEKAFAESEKLIGDFIAK